MKRTCLQRKTNADEQNSCEFHPVGILFNERPLVPKENQSIKSFVQMKKIYSLLFFVVFAISTLTTNAQGWSTGADLVSSYVWRGSKAGAASIQPSVKYATGGLTVGAWGSYDLVAGAPDEADLYASYAFKFGLSLGVTDYHYNTSKLFADDAHALEANLGYSIGKFSLAGNYIFNAASGSIGDDKYFEAGYQFSAVKLFVGAGDGWHTNDASFQVCNIGATTTKSIKFSDSFSLPFTGSVIVNPNKEQVFFVVGISL